MLEVFNRIPWDNDLVWFLYYLQTQLYRPSDDDYSVLTHNLYHNHRGKQAGVSMGYLGSKIL